MAKRRKLRLWEALALSLGLMGPTLAMAGNGQGVIGTVGKAVPLVFLLGFVGVSLVAYGFIRLTQRYNHAGSAYALVGATLGPRAGFVAGFTLFGSYLFFAICTGAVFGAFVNALFASFADGAPALGFGLTAIVCLGLSGYLNTRDTTTVSRLLLAIEGIGIAAMIVLVGVIFGDGGADSTGIDMSVFAGDVDLSAVLAAVVAAFLSWAGFEACAALGEETDQPRKNIPRALFGSVLLTGALFVLVMFAQTVGFGTDEQGLANFQNSGNTLGSLGQSYVGHWFALILLGTAVLSAFASNLASVAVAARLAMALSRHGFGPPILSRVDPVHHTPRSAVIALVIVAMTVNVVSWLTGWPEMGTGDAAIDSYFFFAVTGATCLMFVYLLVEVAVFAAWRRKQIDIGFAELLIPGFGGAFIVIVIAYGVKDASGVSPTYLALVWVLLALAIAAAASQLANRIGTKLTAELDPSEGPTGHDEATVTK